ncbi:MAG: hypothetical protein J4G09_14785 [Proteobacteria bacterium]|nr:hypothetical protein [Pseudomonadota bacterium]
MSDDPHRTAYDPDLTLREARSIYFAANDFGSDGGYAKRWVRLQIGLVPVFFPNLPSRLRAVRFHDLHHVLTGYATDWRGEGEIGAWEIGAGCGRESFAWFADLLSLVPGLLVAPRATFRAYVRGRRSRNLYGRRFDDALLARRVGEVRREIGLDPGDPPPRPGELWRFAGWTALGLGILLSPLLLPLGLLALLA